MTLKFDGWPWKTTGHLFDTTLSFVQHFKAIGVFKLELQPENAKFGSKLAIFFCPGWHWKLTDDLEKHRAPLLCWLKLSASFHSHWWIQNGVTVRKRPNWVKIDNFFYPCDLEIWRMTLKNNRAPLLSNMKLCASFHRYMWIQTIVTVRKRLKGSWPPSPWPLTSNLDLLHGHHVCQW